MGRKFIYVVPTRDGWHVRVAGMAWEYSNRLQAIASAEDMARSYAEATGDLAVVKVQEESAREFSVLRSFGTDRESRYA